MMWLMFIVYLIQPVQNVQQFDVVLVREAYKTQEECGKAGKAMVAKLENDSKVVQIVAGTCLPSAEKKI